MSLSYAQLTQAILDYTSNNEPTFVSNIPVFIETTEQRIYNSVQIPAIRKNQTGFLTTGNQYLGLPSDWLSTFSLAVIDPATLAYTYLIDKDVNFIREAYPTAQSQGMPNYFAQFDVSTLILGPTADEAYQVELHYYYYPESIVAAGSSWLGENFPEVLLYGSLREAYIFMKGEADVLEMYEKKYMEGMARLKQLGDGKNRRDAYRDGQVRVPVT